MTIRTIQADDVATTGSMDSLEQGEVNKFLSVAQANKIDLVSDLGPGHGLVSGNAVTNTFIKASATDTTLPMIGIAVMNGDDIDVRKAGDTIELTAGEWQAVIDGGAAPEAGQQYYLSITAGKLVLAQPAGVNQLAVTFVSETKAVVIAGVNKYPETISLPAYNRREILVDTLRAFVLDTNLDKQGDSVYFDLSADKNNDYNYSSLQVSTLTFTKSFYMKLHVEPYIDDDSGNVTYISIGRGSSQQFPYTLANVNSGIGAAIKEVGAGVFNVHAFINTGSQYHESTNFMVKGNSDFKIDFYIYYDIENIRGGGVGTVYLLDIDGNVVASIAGYTMNLTGFGGYERARFNVVLKTALSGQYSDCLYDAYIKIIQNDQPVFII